MVCMPLSMRVCPLRLCTPDWADLARGLALARASFSRPNHSSLTASWFDILCCSS